MSEVTMSAARVAGLERSDAPLYDPYLVERIEPILRECREKGIRIISNQGWLDPVGAAKRIAELAESLGIADYKIAAVDGGGLTDRIADMGLSSVETGEPLAHRRADIVSAEAYLGAGGIVEALRDGAECVITTRIADGALYLGPLAYEFGWAVEDYDAMARGMVIGHLMECGTQISGGYFCDPGYKDVPGLADLGSPIAEVTRDEVIITKTAGSGGIVSTATCAEQLLYEVEDPANYLCPDCIADFTQVGFEQVGPDRVRVLIGAVGKPKTPYLKALVGVKEGFMTEEMVIFAGPGALERAQMTEEILRERFRKINLIALDVRFDYLGLNAVHREATPANEHVPYEIILRIALKTDSREEANKLRREVDPLAVNGLAGTGKWATSSPGSRGSSSGRSPREAIAD
jgi:hypothetical protein